MKIKTKEMILAGLFAALTVIGAKINLLLPDVPVTLQPIIVMLAGSLLGSRVAFLSQLIYLLSGLIGLPVFAKPIAGPAYILQPSFGYLIGFVLAAYIIGLIVEKSNKTIYTFFAANVIGIIIIYFFGIIFIFALMNLYMGKHINIYYAISIGAAPFILKDLILGIAVSIVSYSIYKRTRLVLKDAN